MINAVLLILLYMLFVYVCCFIVSYLYKRHKYTDADAEKYLVEAFNSDSIIMTEFADKHVVYQYGDDEIRISFFNGVLSAGQHGTVIDKKTGEEKYNWNYLMTTLPITLKLKMLDVVNPSQLRSMYKGNA